MTDPGLDELLEQRVRQARQRLHDAVGDVPAPEFGEVQARRDHRRMGAAAAAIAVVLAGSLAAAIATDDDGTVSTTEAPTAPTAPAIEQTTTTSSSPTTTTSAAPATAAPTTTAPTTTSAPATTTTAAADDAPPDPATQLRGRTFAGTTVTDAGEPRPLIEGTEITVTFEHRAATDEDIVRWDAGCNTWGDSVVITPGRLDLGGDIGGTQVGCSEAHHEQDAWLANFFRADPYWRLEGTTLTLTVDDTIITLAERR